MRVLIVGLIVLALSVAGISTYLIKTFSTDEGLQKLEQEAEKAVTRVLIASATLRPGDKISGKNVAWRKWPKESVDKTYIVIEKEHEKDGALKKVAGQFVRREVPVGAPLTKANLFKREKAGFMSGMLQPGMQAVAVPVRPKTSSAGFIFPGDRVDVLLINKNAGRFVKNFKPEGDKAKTASAALKTLTGIQRTAETILSDIRVIAVDQTVNPGNVKGNAVRAKTVSLEVTPKQAQILILAGEMGTLSLVLRSVGETDARKADRPFTTDIEVSPFIRQLEEMFTSNKIAEAARGFAQREKDLLSKEAASRQEASETEQELRAEIERLRGAQQAKTSGAKPMAVKPVRKKKAPTKPVVIKVYRGGTDKTEEVTTGAQPAK